MPVRPGQRVSSRELGKKGRGAMPPGSGKKRGATLKRKERDRRRRPPGRKKQAEEERDVGLREIPKEKSLRLIREERHARRLTRRPGRKRLSWKRKGGGGRDQNRKNRKGKKKEEEQNHARRNGRKMLGKVGKRKRKGESQIGVRKNLRHKGGGRKGGQLPWGGGWLVGLRETLPGGGEESPYKGPAGGRVHAGRENPTHRSRPPKKKYRITGVRSSTEYPHHLQKGANPTPPGGKIVTGREKPHEKAGASAPEVAMNGGGGNL